MDTIIALSYLALTWSVLCSAQQSTSIVATLQLPDEIFSPTPFPTTFSGWVSTSIGDSELVTAYTIPCDDQVFSLCRSFTGYGLYLEFTAITRSTTYDLPNSGTIICGITDYSGTALCTATAGIRGYYNTPGSSYIVVTESSSYAIYFSSMDEDLAFSLGATTTTYNPTSAAASPSAAMTTTSQMPSITSSSAGTPISPTTSAAMTTTSQMSSIIPSSAGTPMSPTTSAPSTSASSDAATSIAQTAQTTSSSPNHHLTKHKKIGVGVGIVAFVLVCCAAGFGLKIYRQKRRAANPNPSELYFNTDEKGQASGTQL